MPGPQKILDVTWAAGFQGASTRRCTAPNRQLNRVAATNDPLVRADGRTPQGRWIRDLYRAWHVAMGQPNDPAAQAGILAAAELLVAAESARTLLLAGTGDVDQVVRLENLSGRAVRKLGIKPACQPPGNTSPAALRSVLAMPLLANGPTIALLPVRIRGRPATVPNQMALVCSWGLG
jgi:hypothetical protein